MTNIARMIQSLLDSFQTNKRESSHAKLNLNTSQLEKNIGYRFKNKSLLIAALTHNSYLRKTADDPNDLASPFERMEFLGDSILGLIVAEELFSLYPQEREGVLSKIKSKIVCEKYLARRAKTISLGDYLILSDEEDKAGGRDRKSIVSDAMESVLCAVYLDGGMEGAHHFVHSILLNNFQEDIKSSYLTNYKSILQEYSQSLYQEPPVYELLEEFGPEHEKTFIMQVILHGKDMGNGKGENKKQAQQNAARFACQQLKIAE